MKNFGLLFTITLLFTSCAFHSGIFQPTSFEKHHQYVAFAAGSARTIHVFNIGGLSKEALVLEAKQVMQTLRPLGPDERYANITVDFKYTYWLIGLTTKAVVAADVIKFVPDTVQQVYSNEYYKALFNRSNINSMVALGDSIYINENISGIVYSALNSGKAFRVFCYGKNYQGPIKIMRLNSHQIFFTSTQKNINGYKVGDQVQIIYDHFGTKSYSFKGVIHALGLKDVKIFFPKTAEMVQVSYSEIVKAP